MPTMSRQEYVVVPIRKGGVFVKGDAHHEQARICGSTDKERGGV